MAFALLALLLVALVTSGRVRAEEEWMLFGAVGALALVAGAFGFMLRLALQERKDE